MRPTVKLPVRVQYDYSGSFPNLQYITSHANQSTPNFSITYNIRRRPESRWSGTVAVELRPAYVTSSKYPLQLPNLLHFSGHCRYAYFRLNW